MHKFQEVAKILTKEIQKGAYRRGEKLPSEYQLANDFKVSRLTIRKAIDSLCKENLLVKEIGKGTYVLEDLKITSGEKGLVSFTEAALKQGKTSQTKLLLLEEQSRSQLPKKVAAFFPQKETFLHFIRLRLLEGIPMVVEEDFLPKEYLIETKEQELAGSLFSLLEQTNSIGYSKQKIEAAMPTESELAQLQLPENTPILLVRSLTYTPASQPLLYSRSSYRGDKYRFENILTR